jgi:electron transfer DM13
MPSKPAPPRLLLQVAVMPVVAALVVLGVWVAGGLVTDDFRGSVALTTIWFLLAAGVCLLVAFRSRTLRIPVIATYVLTAGAIGVFLASTTLRDRVVSERVVTGVEVEAPAPPVRESPKAAPQPTNVRLVRGAFTSGEHPTRGTATVVRLVNGRRYLTLTDFSTSPGPDLRVRLASSRTLDGAAADAVDLGALKGNRGDQQYRLPINTDVRRRAVVIWCRAFSARFGSAVLR